MGHKDGLGRETRPIRKEQPYPIHLSGVMIVTARAIHESPLRKEQPYPIHLSAVMIVGFGRPMAAPTFVRCIHSASAMIVGYGRPLRNQGMIATGNHFNSRFAALCNTPYREWGTRSVGRVAERSGPFNYDDCLWQSYHDSIMNRPPGNDIHRCPDQTHRTPFSL